MLSTNTAVSCYGMSHHFLQQIHHGNKRVVQALRHYLLLALLRQSFNVHAENLSLRRSNKRIQPVVTAQTSEEGGERERKRKREKERGRVEVR